MGKISAAKKKARRADFQKVKFKVGKKLQKNLNETRATFKAKTLIIKQQFATQEKEGPVSHRNLSWKELLAHLGHHNQSIKLDALNSLKEICLSNGEFVRAEISNLLENICPLFVDRDYKVRETVFALFKTGVLGLNRTVHLLRPFHELIAIHLSCAMTHIMEKVQYSSLKLLDILIELMPDLVVANANKIFSHFIDQISNLSPRTQKRVLKNDPCKLTSTQNWRHNVLNRLYQMLLVISKYTNSSSSKSTQKSAGKIATATRSISFDCCVVEFGPTSRKMIADSDEFSSTTNFSSSSFSSSSFSHQDFFDNCFRVITPLLIDCWIEARPDEKQEIDSDESVQMMHTILLVNNLLVEQLDDELSGQHLDDKALKKEHIFLSQFPYTMDNQEFKINSNDANNATGNTDPSTTAINSHTINLQLCRFCSLGSLNRIGDQEKLFKIFEYGLNMMANRNASGSLSANELSTVLKLSDTIFTSYKSSELVRPFLVGLVNLFAAASVQSSNKLQLFEFLCAQFETKSNLGFCSEKVFVAFYKRALKYLVAYQKTEKKGKQQEEKGRDETVDSILDWVRRLTIKKEKSLPAILAILQDEYIHVLNSIDFGSHSSATESTKRKVLELIYWLPKLTRYLFTKLSHLMLHKSVGQFGVSRVLGIIQMRIDNDDKVNNNKEGIITTNASCMDQSDYLMLLMNLLNGQSSFDLLDQVQNAEQEQVGREEGCFLFADLAKLKRQVSLVKCVLDSLYAQSNRQVIVDIMLSCSVPMMNRVQACPASTLYGLISLISLLPENSLLDISSYSEIVILLGRSVQVTVNNLILEQNQQQQQQQQQQLTSQEMSESETRNECYNMLLVRMLTLLENNPSLCVDLIVQGYASLNNHNQSELTMEDIRSKVLVISYLLNKFAMQLRQNGKNKQILVHHLNQFLGNYQWIDKTKYVWWNEFINILSTEL